MNGNEGFFGAFEKTAFVVIIVLLLVIAWLNWQMALFGLLFVVVAYLYSSRAVCVNNDSNGMSNLIRLRRGLPKRRILLCRTCRQQ